MVGAKDIYLQGNSYYFKRVIKVIKDRGIVILSYCPGDKCSTKAVNIIANNGINKKPEESIIK